MLRELVVSAALVFGVGASAQTADAKKVCKTKTCHERVENRQAIKKLYPFCNTWRCVYKQSRKLNPTQRCIIHHESRGNPLATNGQYKGIAQWSPEAWARMGGLKFGPTPHHATYHEQVRVLKWGYARYGCQDWCPFDPC